jgi:hypothetical protein
MGTQGRTVDERIARLATAHKGVLSVRELRAAGISARQIRRRVERGLFIPQHRAVYRVGHTAPSTEATYLAAVKACGNEAYLCGRAANYHHSLLPRSSPPPPEVMCRTQRSVAGVKTKRVRRIHRLDVCTHQGIPTVTVPRALLDLAAESTDEELLRACHEAWVKWKTGPREIQAVIDRHPNAKGAGRLRRVITGETKVTLSRLESAFLSLLQLEGIEPPETNEQIDGKYVDCRWRGRLTVELVSFAFHASHWAWEQDHWRRRAARKRGEEFRTYTWTDVNEGRSEMAAEIRALLRG